MGCFEAGFLSKCSHSQSEMVEDKPVRDEDVGPGSMGLEELDLKTNHFAAENCLAENLSLVEKFDVEEYFEVAADKNWFVAGVSERVG